MDFNWKLIVDSLPLLIGGAGITIQITLMSVGFGFFIGLVVSLMNLSRFRVIRLIAKCYVELFRGTPLLVQIFMIYFGGPKLLGAIVNANGAPEPIGPYLAAVLACSINSGAYVSEIFRAGIQSINKGQMEAFKAIIPPLGNEFIAMLKDTSLVAVIGFEELTRRGQLIIARTYGSFEIWTAVAVIYLIMTLTISRLVAYLERKYNIK